MPTAVYMPTFGMTEGEAIITRWLKAPGQPVKLDEPLFEAETEKATLEVPSPASGVLQSILVEAGEPVKLTAVVAWLADAGETQPQPLEPVAEAVFQPETANLSAAVSPGASTSVWVKASPIAQRMAREYQIDLAVLKGSGPGGRVVEKDVRTALMAHHDTAPALETGLPERTPEAPAETAASNSDLTALTATRRTTARRMAVSAVSIPQFTLQIDVRAARLVDLRTQLNASGLHGRRPLSFTTLLARAAALAMPAHPLLNASWEEGQVRVYHEVHLGIAVAAPQGLVVPVIRNAGALTLWQLNEELARLAESAREGGLNPAELLGGTFTLTNLGMYGIDRFTPLINPPQSTILAAGAIAERPVGEGGQVVLRPTLTLSLVADHRVLDGIQAAMYLKDLKDFLEAPARLL